MENEKKAYKAEISKLLEHCEDLELLQTIYAIMAKAPQLAE